jgi:meso-butanediol dehydrogenase / (S,S)-butanediol dehydrogenase / diacetyl reductase
MRTAIITGAGTGVGAATARLLAADGIAVVLTGRRGELLESVAAGIREDGGAARVLVADLADPATAQALVDVAVDVFGGLDVLVNNAAVIRNGPLAGFTREQFDLHFAVNVRAPFLLTQAALPAMRASEAPAIVNVSSSIGSMVKPKTTLYAMTKAALEYMTRATAYELAEHGIRVNAVALGPVDTPIHATYADDVEAAYADLARRVPLGRMGAPDDVARWIRWLSAPETDWVTGAVIPVDGGQVLGIPEAAGG